MKKQISILLLSIYFISTTELYQLLKLPILIEHYAEHKAQNSELTFMDFLSLHYNQEFDHDTNDKKLPFKSHESNISSSIVAFISQPILVSFSKPIDYKVRIESTFHNVIFSSTVISTIWQPPRA